MSCQVGRPSLKCNASQLVLKYVLSHKTLLVSTWRSRIYYYSSATTFANVCEDLEHFIDTTPRGKCTCMPRMSDKCLARA